MNSGSSFQDKKLAAEVRKLKAQLRRREEENVSLAKKIEQLESENDETRRENRDLRQTLNRAKDISPWMRPNRGNVKRMAKKAFLDIVKAPGGWVVKMGERIGKKFKRLRDIWLILTKEDWNLHDEFLPYQSTPTPTPTPQTNKELAEIEVLRAEWRMFPSMRPAIEEAMARFGIALEPT